MVDDFNVLERASSQDRMVRHEWIWSSLWTSLKEQGRARWFINIDMLVVALQLHRGLVIRGIHFMPTQGRTISLGFWTAPRPLLLGRQTPATIRL